MLCTAHQMYCLKVLCAMLSLHSKQSVEWLGLLTAPPQGVDPFGDEDSCCKTWPTSRT